ncbi:sulfatase [Thalassotalea fonticola]|uniref:Sulfatase n=1 Tax=Thalassotalea fonticola TaxID=3065649 RepID=A0ABZ0GM40_9GAMM|nr:sulfatase [Colwelliaceae bacterium S1-1]
MIKKIILSCTITTLVTTSLLSSAFAASKRSEKDKAERPNVVVIMTDEHNFRTLGAYRKLMSKEQGEMWGKEVVETPNIDWLADNGAIATSFYSSAPVCTPARGSFFSGMYPQNNGAVQNNVPLREDAITFAHILKDKGYATGYIGKWHLDGGAKPLWAPERSFGFDDNRYMYNRGHWKQFVDTETGSKIAATNEKGKPTYSAKGADSRSFSTDYQFGKVINFIDTNRDKPFLMMLSLSDPHGPDTVRSPYDTMYQDIEFQRPRTQLVDADKAPIWAQPSGSKKAPNMKNYYGMVKLIDDSMARLYAELRHENLMENTIIVFTSDHGDLKGEHGRQNKGNPFEGSARIPFLVYYPSKIPAKTVIPQALTTVDFQQTLLGLIGVNPSGNEEGRDATPLLSKVKDASKQWQDIAFMRQSSKTGEGWLTAITERYKLVYNPEGEPWLFDLEKDPDELINFYKQPAYKEQVRFMATEMKNYAMQRNDIFLLDNEHMTKQVNSAINAK